VDLTASENEPSWGDDTEGGLFTRSFMSLIQEGPRDLDRNMDGFVTWSEFYPALRVRTNRKFQEFRSHIKRQEGGADDPIKQTKQTPRAYSFLPDTPMTQQPCFAVVGLTNRTKQVVKFKYRWSSSDLWNEEQLPVGQRLALWYPLASAGGTLPPLEVLENGAGKSERMEPYRWEGNGPPAYEQGKKYSFYP